MGRHFYALKRILTPVEFRNLTIQRRNLYQSDPIDIRDKQYSNLCSALPAGRRSRPHRKAFGALLSQKLCCSFAVPQVQLSVLLVSLSYCIQMQKFVRDTYFFRNMYLIDKRLLAQNCNFVAILRTPITSQLHWIYFGKSVQHAFNR